MALFPRRKITHLGPMQRPCVKCGGATINRCDNCMRPLHVFCSASWNQGKMHCLDCAKNPQAPQPQTPAQGN